MDIKTKAAFKDQENAPMLDMLSNMPEYNRLLELLDEGAGSVLAHGLPEAHRAHVFAAVAQARGGLFIAASEKSAKRLYLSASALSARVTLLDLRELPLVNAYAASYENAQSRLNTLMRLALGERLGVIVSAEAAMQALAPPQVIKSAMHTLKLSQVYPPRALLEALFDAGYEPVELVNSPGQVSLRGDILDVFAPHSPLPYRVEFFDDEIDRMSVYDAQTQRSMERVEEILLPPATEAPQDARAIARARAKIEHAAGFDAIRMAYDEGHTAPNAQILMPILYDGQYTIFDHVCDAPIFVEDIHKVEETASANERLFMQEIEAMLARGEGLQEQAGLLINTDAFMKKLHTNKTVLVQTLLRMYPQVRPKETLDFSGRVAPLYMNERGELAQDLLMQKELKTAIVLYAGAHAERLSQQLLDAGLHAPVAKTLTRQPVHGEVIVLEDSLPIGFLYPSLKLTVLTEAELYGFVRGARSKSRSKEPRLLFSELKPGDLIVHEMHGIGRFVGVEALTVQNTTRDYLLMEYAGNDRLYIPTDQLDRVQKYIGGDVPPKLSKLGGNDWQRTVSRAKSAVKELAFDLAKLYADREKSKGFAFSIDTPWQKQLEERFSYTETPDQLQSIEDIKRDMESERVMDRLLCGDVGYGKTEVALRAAFKAIQDSKQVAFLVPTTILAQQHYNTISSRFSGFPIRVNVLSRFKSAQEQKKIKESLKSGAIDFIVGTHALLSKDVRFKDLGLLIVDEEQRFGVGHKEQIKTLKHNVDVLTLTATPIPRTLHMSMIGIRDLSVIDTPPEERFPVQTYVLEYSDTLLSDVLKKELSRGGQCYVVYNQVRRLESLRERVHTLIPDARVAIAHGQMQEAALEKVMLDYLERRIDVLLCSTIVENGLDIPNANTLFVLDADKMGLSQLYQLRGRVGRSTRLGYAYFTFARHHALSEIAHKRLSALTEFARFGAGRDIAMRDLEIRGAGSLLGAQQHGHIADIGYEYYCKLMGAAVKEARSGEAPPVEIDTVIDIPLDMHIPKYYIKSEVQRLSMYKRIAMIKSREALFDVQEEMEDRYGDIPEPVQNLMDASLLKAAAARAGALMLTLRDASAKLVFHSEANLDGATLVHAAASYGAQLVPGDMLSLLYKREHLDVKHIMREILPMLDTLGA